MKTVTIFDLKIKEYQTTMEKCHTLEAKLVFADMIKDLKKEALAATKKEVQKNAKELKEQYQSEMAASYRNQRNFFGGLNCT